jgi:hypothetical protein
MVGFDMVDDHVVDCTVLAAAPHALQHLRPKTVFAAVYQSDLLVQYEVGVVAGASGGLKAVKIPAVPVHSPHPPDLVLESISLHVHSVPSAQ